jgi:transmembrane sensor
MTQTIISRVVSRESAFDEAVEWLVRVSQCYSLETRLALLAWLRESPLHVEALLLTAVTCREFAGADLMVKSAISEAVTAACECSRVNDESYTQPRYLPRSPRMVLAGACSAVSVVVAVLVVWFQKPTAGLESQRAVVYVKAQSYQLGNLSTMNLGSRSHAEVRPYGPNGLGSVVDLVQGNAEFSGVHDDARPLRVRVGHAVIDAIGTDFRVQREGDTTQVTVMDGRVKLGCDEPGSSTVDQSLAGSTHSGTLLSKGQSGTVYSSDCSGSVTVKDIPGVAVREKAQTPPEWLVFVETTTTVQKAVDTFNRYNTRRMEVKDSELGEQPVGGRFRTTDPSNFILFLEVNFGAKASQGLAPDGSEVTYLVGSRYK